MLAFPAKLSQILYVEYIVYKLQMVQLLSFMMYVGVLLLLCFFFWLSLFLLFQPIFQKRISLVHVKVYLSELSSELKDILCITSSFINLQVLLPLFGCDLHLLE